MMSNKTYDILKWVAMVLLPAIATLYLGLAELWGLPYSMEIPATITLFDAFLGALLQIQSSQYKKTNTQ